MLYLTIKTDTEEDFGFIVRVSGEKTPDAIPVELTHWGAGAAEFAEAIYNNVGSADGLSALIAAVAQTAFNAGVLHQRHRDGQDLIGVAQNP